MAAYYHAPRRQRVPLGPIYDPQQYAHHRQPFLDLADSPTYIFPNPSSTPPSPTEASDLSYPSDISLSAISMSELDSQYASPCHFPENDYSPTPRQLPLSSLIPTFELSRDLQFSPQAANVNVESVNDTRGGLYLAQRPDLASGAVITKGSRRPPLRVSTTPTCPSRSDQVKTPRPEHPHNLLRIPLPFLSLLSTLFGIEESTLDHLTSPTSPSVLFSVEKSSDVTDTSQYSETTPPAHGLEKLFSAVATEKGCKSVRQGMLYSDSPTFPPLGLLDLWHLVASIVANGGEALRG